MPESDEKTFEFFGFDFRGIEQEVFKSDRQKSNSTHGTGCALSAAIEHAATT